MAGAGRTDDAYAVAVPSSGDATTGEDSSPDVLDFSLSTQELLAGSAACVLPLLCVLVAMARARSCREPFLVALGAQSLMRAGMLAAMLHSMSELSEALFMDLPGLVCVSVYSLLVVAWAVADSDSAAFDEVRAIGPDVESVAFGASSSRRLSVGSLSDSDEEAAGAYVAERARSTSRYRADGAVPGGTRMLSTASAASGGGFLCLGERAATSAWLLLKVNACIYLAYFAAMACVVAFAEPADFGSTASPAIFFFLFAFLAIGAAGFGYKYCWTRRSRPRAWVEAAIVTVIVASFAARAVVAVTALGELEQPDMQWPSSALYYGLAEVLPNVLVAVMFPCVPSAVESHLLGTFGTKAERQPLLKGGSGLLGGGGGGGG
eukprot:CAMPEP_0203812916 /NCGR_PEP_ID=MMETSP0115-20131106/4423_1 /ASSEMBLY_ACC=CAM_ASM_000227 /TAXON_ID=33651 /ORGANISM="Bicosoecid sp, Strain ms1" /LENGTH=377 /DNA_ID=CAMNT_0050721771 /DNA_START=117 /DNA_END=1246 /DNA_ORIENTATION=-